MAGTFGHPKESLSPRKRRTLSMVAVWYLKRKGWLERSARFDVVTVTPQPSGVPKVWSIMRMPLIEPIDRAVSSGLYVVATPIGNLEDITFRAVRVLKTVDFIAAEDTRRTRKLLSHYGIANRLVAYHTHNRSTSGPRILKRLQEGACAALTSDGGTPACFRPGPGTHKRRPGGRYRSRPRTGTFGDHCRAVCRGFPGNSPFISGLSSGKTGKPDEQAPGAGMVPPTRSLPSKRLTASYRRCVIWRRYSGIAK